MLHEAIERPSLTYSSRPRSDAEAIVGRHAPLVRRVAWHVHSRVSSAIEVEDLIQTGMIALIEAARGFEDRGIAFAPYATTRVRGAMIDQLRREARLSRTGMVARRQLAQARNRIEQRLGRHADDMEMAIEMGLESDAYHALEKSTRAVRQDSLDDCYSDHDPLFADLEERADAALEAKEKRALLARAIDTLPEREAMVLSLYFVEEMNLDEIGLTLGVGAARVCQIKKAALEKLRTRLDDVD